jgi:hemerythrin superfamily protein
MALSTAATADDLERSSGVTGRLAANTKSFCGAVSWGARASRRRQGTQGLGLPRPVVVRVAVDRLVRVPKEPLAPKLNPGLTMTTPKTASKSTARDKIKPESVDAIALLKADHEAVSQLFAEVERTRSVPNKKALVAQICTALSVHAQIEEEIFYPAVKDKLKDKLLIAEAMVEHTGVKDLIVQLEGAEPDGEMYDAKVKVLSEYVKHHVKEEHNEMFPKAMASSIDMLELGARLAARREALLAQTAGSEPETS